MKQFLLILLCLLSFTVCVKAKKTPLDPNSPYRLLPLISNSNRANPSSSGSPTITYLDSYQFYISESANFKPTISSGVKSCSISPTLPMGLIFDKENCSVGGIAEAISTRKSYNILAMGERDSATTSVIFEVVVPFRIFASNTQVAGNITINGADNTCNSDGAKPNTGTYKAMLASSTRRACSNPVCSVNGIAENLDWVLKASSIYVNSDRKVRLGQTEANGIFLTPIKDFSTSGNNLWTGINFGFTNSPSNCLNWTSNSAANLGHVGRVVSSDFIMGESIINCNILLRLVCVEQ
jgi:hypothetical protein